MVPEVVDSFDRRFDAREGGGQSGVAAPVRLLSGLLSAWFD